VSGGKHAAGAAKKACCMVSEILEEAGLDRARARQIRRQLLEGVILMCQWQLQRMHEKEALFAEFESGGLITLPVLPVRPEEPFGASLS
jgi:hypothetical protein